MLTLLLIMLIITIDLDPQQTWSRLKNLFQKIIRWWKKQDTDDQPEQTQTVPEEKNKDYEDEELIELAETPIKEKLVKEEQLEFDELEISSKEQPEITDTIASEKTVKPNADLLLKPVKTMKKELEGYDESIKYIFPSIDLLDSHIQQPSVTDEEVDRNKRNLIDKLSQFGIEITKEIDVQKGPVFSLYEVTPPESIKVSQIVNLEDDIQLALEAKRIRIIAPMPGKGTVGIEISNRNPSNVYFREIITSKQFKEARYTLPIAMGRTTVAMEQTTTGEIFCADLASIPHLLIAGATGSGKSIGINTIISSLLYKMSPLDVKFVFIDPKKVELRLYSKLKDHFLAKCPDIEEDIITDDTNAIIVLKSVVKEMERRYDILAKSGVRNIKDFNAKIHKGELTNIDGSKTKKLPYIVVIIDELADLMMKSAKEVEEPISRIAQLARAVGLHLIIATQRPSVDVITGTIKANFPARIAYQVASTIDSRTILNMNGAEDLIGKGDMLFLSSVSPKPIRIQNAYISTEEVEKIVDFIGKQRGGRTGPFELPTIQEKRGSNGIGGSGSGENDELFEEAAKLIVRHQQGSVSLIQRRLKVGYSRAARIVDELEMAGIVGPFDGSKARAVLIETEEELDNILNNL
jgi:S-DNA-T family DNA segregation ATPase FtsK/SpoIIIE